MTAPTWDPDPNCQCFACRLEAPIVVREQRDLAKHMFMIGRECARRGKEMAGDEWNDLRCYLFQFRLPEWLETALLQRHCDRYMAEQRFAGVLYGQAVLGSPPPAETVDRLRAEVVEMRECYAQAMARHGRIVA